MQQNIDISPVKVKKDKKKIPLKEGLFLIPSNPGKKPQLIVGKCAQCAGVAFPISQNCPNCQTKDMQKIFVSGPSILYSFTSVLQQPPGYYYKGEVPYLVGYVELPEGIRLRTLLVDCSLEDLKIGMEMELVIDKLHDNENGDEVVTYKFRPIKMKP